MSAMHAPSPDADKSLTQLFVTDVPVMAGIVGIVTQPFAQQSLRAVLGLPEWAPILLALGVSALLALYKLMIVRRSHNRECAICVPIMMLVVFATYATGNNVVYYAKEGLARPLTSEQVATLQHERDNLQAQLKNAEGVIATMRGALGLPDPATGQPTSALPTAWTRLFGVSPADAQPRTDAPPRRDAQPRPAPPRDAVRSPNVDMQRLQDELKKYDARQQQLKTKLQTINPETNKPLEQQQQQQPLIKSW